MLWCSAAANLLHVRTRRCEGGDMQPGVWAWSGRCGATLVTLLLLTWFSFRLLAVARPVEPQSAEAWDEDLPIRPVRVLLAADAPRIRLRTSGVVRLYDADGIDLGTFRAKRWHVVPAGSPPGLRFGSDDLDLDRVTLVPATSEPIWLSVERQGAWSEERAYPGKLELTLSDTGAVSVINLPNVEAYVACVVAQEIWPSFHAEAYRCQAIATRTYVLYRMQRRNRRTYDVTSTEASQVYRGLRRDQVGRRAAAATRKTRGLVCAYSDRGDLRLFPTYYSSVCGGVTQSAELFNGVTPVAPLAGGVECDYCRDAPQDAYRWGPVTLPLKDVFERVTARYPDLQRLGRLTSVAISRRGASGRPSNILLTGAGGQKHEMSAESFRLAVGSRQLRSTWCEVTVRRGKVTFSNGRGFGHGVGLCQWGMQGQARAGKEAGEILRFYYPGCTVTRAY